MAAAAPCPTLPPAIAAPPAPSVGDVLSLSAGTWVSPDPRFSWSWLRCSGDVCNAIPGAEAQTYTVTGDDVGYVVRADVTSSGTFGSARNTARATAVVGRVPSLSQWTHLHERRRPAPRRPHPALDHRRR